jgi:hypothetical protein
MYFVSSPNKLLTAIELLSSVRISQRDYISSSSVPRDRSEIEVTSHK